MDVGDFTLNGADNFPFDSQKIDVAPLVASGFDIDGTPIIRAVTSSSNSSFLTATFDSPITAFGATFRGVSDNGFTQLTAGSDLVGDVPTYVSTAGFFGFVADGSFTTVTLSGSNGDAFGMDNFVYTTSSTPVPFEVSPTLGLLTIGGIWGVSRLRKKREISK